MQFNNISDHMASAIAAVYSSPAHLLKVRSSFRVCVYVLGGEGSTGTTPLVTSSLFCVGL